MAAMAPVRESPPSPARTEGGRRVSARAASVSPSATLAVDAKAKAMVAAGEDVIGFGAGEPDFPTPSPIVEAAAAACRQPQNHHYTATAGLAELREAIVGKTQRDSGLEVSPAQVVVTNGAKQAVYEAFMGLLDPGDEVLVPAPFWTTYPEAIALAGGTPIAVGTDEANGFHLTVEALDRAWTPATKVLLFVSPNNPTGAVATSDEVLAIGRWAAERGVWVVTDEIYEHLVYGGRSFTSMPAVVPELTERCVVINGVAKTYAMTGWRVGWLVAPPDLAAAVTNLQSHSCGNVDNVAQVAALAALNGEQGAVAEMRAVFDRRRVTMHRMLNECPGVTCVEPEGAFYAFPSVRALLGRRLHGRVVQSSLDVADAALDHVKVAVVPGEAFGAPGYLRLSYAMSEDAMVEGVSRLAKLFADAD
jgi:aspartate/methionine/tyrosine aminotransferase